MPRLPVAFGSWLPPIEKLPEDPARRRWVWAASEFEGAEDAQIVACADGVPAWNMGNLFGRKG